METNQDLDAIEAQDGSIDGENSDGDSGFGEGALSTASVQSSIFDYEEEYGRSYHAFRRGKYVMPNDDREQERMNITYHSLRMSMEDKLYIAPLEHPTAVLDAGTGTYVLRGNALKVTHNIKQGLESGRWTLRMTIQQQRS